MARDQCIARVSTCAEQFTELNLSGCYEHHCQVRNCHNSERIRPLLRIYANSAASILKRDVKKQVVVGGVKDRYLHVSCRLEKKVGPGLNRDGYCAFAAALAVTVNPWQEWLLQGNSPSANGVVLPFGKPPTGLKLPPPERYCCARLRTVKSSTEMKDKDMAISFWHIKVPIEAVVEMDFFSQYLLSNNSK